MANVGGLLNEDRGSYQHCDDKDDEGFEGEHGMQYAPSLEMSNVLTSSDPRRPGTSEESLGQLAGLRLVGRSQRSIALHCLEILEAHDVDCNNLA